MNATARTIACSILLCLALSLFGCGALISTRPTMSLDDIIAPGTEAVLEYDGATGSPDLRMTEGISWMYGKSISQT